MIGRYYLSPMIKGQTTDMNELSWVEQVLLSSLDLGKQAQSSFPKWTMQSDCYFNSL